MRGLRTALVGIVAAAAIVAGGFFDGHAKAASANPAIYGAPAAMVNAGKVCPTSAPCIFQETQDWWVPGNTSLTAPASNFPFISQHDHLGVAWPQGEAIPSQ